MQLNEDPRDVDLMVQKYTYCFDWPEVPSDGSVLVYDNLIILQFPQRVGSPSCLVDQRFLPVIELTVCQKLLFSFSWLPIFSYADLSKCQDMLRKFYYEYLTLLDSYPSQNSSGHHKLYQEHHTFRQNFEFVLDCKESYQQTFINLNISSDLTCQSGKQESHVQIRIGDYVVFCSKRDLKGIEYENVAGVLCFILQKISQL